MSGQTAFDKLVRLAEMCRCEGAEDTTLDEFDERELNGVEEGRGVARKKEEEYLETRRKALAVATEPVTPKILPGPVQPSEVERQHHKVNHLPPVPWCVCHGTWESCPHLRSDLREKGEQLPVIAFDFAFVKTMSASGETEQEICQDSGCCRR